MKRIAILTLTGCLAGMAIAGCSQNNLPPGENGTTAGGNGNFGANPDRPGDYQNSDGQHNSSSTPNQNENAPTPAPQGGGGM